MLTTSCIPDYFFWEMVETIEMGNRDTAVSMNQNSIDESGLKLCPFKWRNEYCLYIILCVATVPMIVGFILYWINLVHYNGSPYFGLR